MKNPDTVIIFPPPMHRIARIYPAPYFLSSFINGKGFYAKPLDLNMIALDRLASRPSIDRHIRALEKTKTEMENSPTPADSEQYASCLRSLARLTYAKRIHVQGDRIPMLMEMELSGVRYTRIFYDIIKDAFNIFYNLNISLEEEIDTFYSCAEAHLLREILRDVINREIIDKQIPIVGFSIPFSQQFIPAMILAREIRDNTKNIHICFGGPVITLLSKKYLEKLLKVSSVDSFVRYRGEVSLLNLLRHKLFEIPIDPTNNLIIDNSSEIKSNYFVSGSTQGGQSARECNLFQKEALDSLPKDAPIPISQSAGCYWKKCSFCDYVNLHRDKTYRPRPVGEIIEDINYYRDLGFQNFRMLAEAIPPKHAYEIATELLNNKLNIKWHSYLRVDKGFSRDIIDALCKSGFRCTVGMESSNECILKTLNKGYDKSIIKDFFENIRNASLRNNHLNIIVGTPGATLSQEMETFEFCREYTDIFSRFKSGIFTLTNTSEMGRNPHKFGIKIKKNENNGLYRNGRISSIPFEDPHGMTHEEKLRILELYNQLNKEVRCRRRFNGYLRRIKSARSGAEIKEIKFTFDETLVHQKAISVFKGNGNHMIVNMYEPRDHQIFLNHIEHDLMNLLKGRVFNCRDVIEITNDENIALNFIKKVADGDLVTVEKQNDNVW